MYHFKRTYSVVLFCAWANATSLLSGQTPDYIRLHGTIESNEVRLNLSAATKEQDSIRATIFNDSKSVVLQLYYTDEGLMARKRTPQSISTQKLSGDEAASNLMDLLALNPDYHFKSGGGFNLKLMESEGYTFELKRADTALEETKTYPPVKLRLFRGENNRNVLIRSIEFIDFDTSSYPMVQPKTLKFTDETTGETGYIRINKIEYNPGLPDFLFEPTTPDGAEEEIKTSISGVDDLAADVFVWPVMNEPKPEKYSRDSFERKSIPKNTTKTPECASSTKKP